MDSEDASEVERVSDEKVEEIFSAYLETDGNALSEESKAKDKGRSASMKMTSRIETYQTAMKCSSCGLIPIPPLKSCSSNHWYCRTCAKVQTACTFEYEDKEICNKKIEPYQDKLYEAIFANSEFSCPWKKNGCTDRFKGKELLNDHVIRNCKFKTSKNVTD